MKTDDGSMKSQNIGKIQAVSNLQQSKLLNSNFGAGGVSVFIQIADDSGDIHQTLLSFLQINTYNPFEFIILDKTPGDKTRKVIDKFATQSFIRYINVSGRENWFWKNWLFNKASYSYVFLVPNGLHYIFDALPDAIKQFTAGADTAAIFIEHSKENIAIKPVNEYIYSEFINSTISGEGTAALVKSEAILNYCSMGENKRIVDPDTMGYSKFIFNVSSIPEETQNNRSQKRVDPQSVLGFINLPKNPHQVNHLKIRLLNLGFLEKASTDLADLAKTCSDPLVQKRAAWELAVFYADKYDKQSAKNCIYWLDKLNLKFELTNIEKDHIAILKAESLNMLNQQAEANLCLVHRVVKSQNPDLFLAMSQYTHDEDAKINWINKVFTMFDLYPVGLKTPNGQYQTEYDRLCSKNVISKDKCRNGQKPLVTIIIPCFNAEKIIHTTLCSLSIQTYENIEVIVVDDCSTDATVDIVRQFINNDSRFCLIQTSENGGPYIARNIGLKQAGGELVTTNDADDWSHPQKIEIQTYHLIENQSVVANTSTQARAKENLTFYRRGNPGFYIQPNMSSLMFRRKTVVQQIGYWDSVRFAGDSEFNRRLKLHFGKEAFVDLLTGPLSFQRQTNDSLTGSSYFGYHGFKMGARKAYEAGHKNFHKKSKAKLYVDFPLIKRPFPVPMPMLPQAKKSTRLHYDVVMVSDFRFQGGTTMSNVEEMKAQSSMGLKTALVQMYCYDLNASREFNSKVTDLIQSGDVDLLVYGQEATADILVLRLPWILEEKQKYIPAIRARDIRVIVNQPPKRDYAKNSECIYHLKRCMMHLKDYFGSSGTWHPIGPLVRQALVEHHGSELEGINLSEEDWPNIINIEEWRRSIPPIFSDQIKICRHSRDQYVKWPDNAKDIVACYPDSDDFSIHVLGGAKTPESVLGGKLPKNWKVKPFGACHPKDFLANCDVFVYFTHPDWVESFGRVILEAMAVGLPVFLPPQYERVFKEAAIYTEPHQVATKVKHLMASPRRYHNQAKRSQEYIQQHYSYDIHAMRLEKAGVDLGLYTQSG